MRKRLRPLALQATAAERAAKLGEELARLQAAIATLDLARLGGAPRGRRRAPRARAAEARRELEAQIAELLAARERAEEELTDAAGTREGDDRRALPAARRRRADRAAPRVRDRRCAPRLRAELRGGAGHDPRASDELEAAAREAAAAAQSAAAERGAGSSSRRRSSWARSPPASARGQRELAAELDDVLGRRSEAEGLLDRCAPRLPARAARARRSAWRCARSRRSGCCASFASSSRDAARARAGPSPDRARPRPPTRPTPRPARRGASATTCRRAAALARERLAALEQSLAEREGLPPAARALAEQGEQLALSRSTSSRATSARSRPRSGASRPPCSRADAEPRTRAARAGARSRSRLARRARRTRSARRSSRRCPSSTATSCSRRAVPAVTRGRPRLGPAARRALVRRRDGRGGAARARGAAARAGGGGGGARRPRGASAGGGGGRRRSARRRPRAPSRRSRTCGACGARDPALLERLVAVAERLDETLRVAAARGRAPRDAARRAGGGAWPDDLALDRGARGRASHAARGPRRACGSRPSGARTAAVASAAAGR